MTILILVGMAVLVGVLLLYVFELGRSRRLLLKAGNARKYQGFEYTGPVLDAYLFDSLYFHLTDNRFS